MNYHRNRGSHAGPAVVAMMTALLAGSAPADASVFITPPPAQSTNLGCLALVAQYSPYNVPGRTITVTAYLDGERQFRRRIRATSTEKSHPFRCGPAELRTGRWRLKVTGAGWNHSFKTRIVREEH